MFVIDRTGELVGYSRWQWDSLYTPSVGCFHRGRLVQLAICELEWQDVGLDGPLERWWFRMRVDPTLVQKLEDDEPEVRLLRLEDAQEVAFAGRDDQRIDRILRVEALLGSTSTDRTEPLTGFVDFLEAPYEHQVETIYRDLLGRPSDDVGRQIHLTGLAARRSLLDLRRDTLLSDEFRNRDIRASDRVGAMLTSPLWTHLAVCEPLNEKRRLLPVVRLSDYEGLSDREFVSEFHRKVQNRAAGVEAERRLEELARDNGRPFVASIILRDAASAGLFWRYTP